MRKSIWTFVMLLAGSCGKGEAISAHSEQVDGPLTVQTVKAADLKAKEYIEVTGILFPKQEVTVMAGVPGEVARVAADEGDFVKKGEPLAVIDQREYRLAVSQARHQVESARLALRQLETDFARQKALHESGSVTDSQLEQIALKLDLARNQLRLAEDGLAIARKKLEDTVIRAPFDCYVTNRLVSVGSRITAMPPTVLFRVIDLANLELKMQVPDSYARHVEEGNRVVVNFASLGQVIEGNVDEVVLSVDPRSMTFTAIMKVDNRALNFSLRPGTMGTAKIFGSGLAKTYLLEKKLFKELDLSSGLGVLLIAVDNKAKATKVRVQPLDDLRVRVVEGLQENDTVIASAISVLQDNQQIVLTQ